jgi:putative addiction module component (TIGR02574 family)
LASDRDRLRLRFSDESLPSRPLKLDFFRMATIAEVEKLALDLPETERAVLAAHLLGSLPSVLHDEDEGIAEALRRDAEFEANPSLGMSLEELDQRIESRRS